MTGFSLTWESQDQSEVHSMNAKTNTVIYTIWLLYTTKYITTRSWFQVYNHAHTRPTTVSHICFLLTCTFHRLPFRFDTTCFANGFMREIISHDSGGYESSQAYVWRTFSEWTFQNDFGPKNSFKFWLKVNLAPCHPNLAFNLWANELWFTESLVQPLCERAANALQGEFAGLHKEKSFQYPRHIFKASGNF